MRGVETCFRSIQHQQFIVVRLRSLRIGEDLGYRRYGDRLLNRRFGANRVPLHFLRLIKELQTL